MVKKIKFSKVKVGSLFVQKRFDDYNCEQVVVFALVMIKRQKDIDFSCFCTVKRDGKVIRESEYVSNNVTKHYLDMQYQKKVMDDSSLEVYY